MNPGADCQKYFNIIENSDSPNASKVAEMLSEMNIASISDRTVQNRLNEADIHGRAPLKKVL